MFTLRSPPPFPRICPHRYTTHSPYLLQLFSLLAHPSHPPILLRPNSLCIILGPCLSVYSCSHTSSCVLFSLLFWFIFFPPTPQRARSFTISSSFPFFLSLSFTILSNTHFRLFVCYLFSPFYNCHPSTHLHFSVLGIPLSQRSKPNKKKRKRSSIPFLWLQLTTQKVICTPFKHSPKVYYHTRKQQLSHSNELQHTRLERPLGWTIPRGRLPCRLGRLPEQPQPALLSQQLLPQRLSRRPG